MKDNIYHIPYLKFIFHLLVSLIWMLSGCSSDDQPEFEKINIPADYPFQVKAGKIMHNNIPWVRHGVNAMNTFGIEDSPNMSNWKVGIVREFIGNLREQPIIAPPLQGADNAWLHPLQAIADRNRSMGMITLFCPFGWVDDSGNLILLTGKNPSEQPFYEAYKLRMREIAAQFKDQPDVWVEVWNEPYHFNNENGYSHRKWLADQQEMVQNLRSVEGFYNIIVVPGNEMGQSEEAILALGHTLVAEYENIVFDVHAYRKWLSNNDEDTIRKRFDSLISRDFAFVIGEIGVFNVEPPLLDPHPFLKVVGELKIPTLAWAWIANEGYPNSLLTPERDPNNVDNNDWGTTFKTFLETYSPL